MSQDLFIRSRLLSKWKMIGAPTENRSLARRGGLVMTISEGVLRLASGKGRRAK